MPVEPPPRAAAPPKPESELVSHAMEEPVVAAETPAVDDGIFSEKTRKALDDTFANIPDAIPEQTVEPRRAATRTGAIEGSSVEAVFERAVSNAVDPLLHEWMDKNKTDLLTAVKPLIREWMDEHFPALLEGAVRNEVERVVKARGNKR
jgi:cell pole-organizing protein PopZ